MNTVTAKSRISVADAKQIVEALKSETFVAEKQLTAREFVDENIDLLNEKLKAGATFRALASAIAKYGLQVTESTLRHYMQDSGKSSHAGSDSEYISLGKKISNAWYSKAKKGGIKKPVPLNVIDKAFDTYVSELSLPKSVPDSKIVIKPVVTNGPGFRSVNLPPDLNNL